MTVNFFEGNATILTNNSRLLKGIDHRIIASKIERKTDNMINSNSSATPTANITWNKFASIDLRILDLNTCDWIKQTQTDEYF